MKPNNVIYLKCTKDSFFRMWIEFLSPFHKLTPRERDVAARVIMQYFRLKGSITDPMVLNELLWSRTSRKDMIESLSISQAHFQIILAKLKSSGVLLEDGSINPRYIPAIGDEPRFMLGVYYDWSSKSSPINAEK